MSQKLNPLLEEGFQETGFTFLQLFALFLSLDQSKPQTISGGMPTFEDGLRSNGAIILRAGQKLIFDGE